jgi:hypothetical protein
MESVSATGKFQGRQCVQKISKVRHQKALEFTMSPLKNWYIKQVSCGIGLPTILG